MASLEDVMSKAEQAVTRLETAMAVVSLNGARTELAAAFEECGTRVPKADSKQIMEAMDADIAILVAVRDDLSGNMTWGHKMEAGLAIVRCAGNATRGVMLCDRALGGDGLG